MSTMRYHYRVTSTENEAMYLNLMLIIRVSTLSGMSEIVRKLKNINKLFGNCQELREILIFCSAFSQDILSNRSLKKNLRAESSISSDKIQNVGNFFFEKIHRKSGNLRSDSKWKP